MSGLVRVVYACFRGRPACQLLSNNNKIRRYWKRPVPSRELSSSLRSAPSRRAPRSAATACGCAPPPVWWATRTPRPTWRGLCECRGRWWWWAGSVRAAPPLCLSVCAPSLAPSVPSPPPRVSRAPPAAAAPVELPPPARGAPPPASGPRSRRRSARERGVGSRFPPRMFSVTL